MPVRRCRQAVDSFWLRLSQTASRKVVYVVVHHRGSSTLRHIAVKQQLRRCAPQSRIAEPFLQHVTRRSDRSLWSLAMLDISHWLEGHRKRQRLFIMSRSRHQALPRSLPSQICPALR